MTELVDPSEIEALVGQRRHPTLHYGRAVSAEETVYILHSQECKDSDIDLRDCRFSVALDNGLTYRWAQFQDQTVVLLLGFGNQLNPVAPLHIEDSWESQAKP